MGMRLATFVMADNSSSMGAMKAAVLGAYPYSPVLNINTGFASADMDSFLTQPHQGIFELSTALTL